jgi:ADP-ribosylation factor related protein 1
MFSLINGFVKWYFSKTEVKVLVVGLDNAGKTTYLERIKSMYSSEGGSSVPLDRIQPTIGLNMGRVQAYGCDVTLWDLGGQQSFRSIWNNYFEDADIIVYVVDAADEERLEEAKTTLQKVLKHSEAARLPLLIFGNKNDIPLAQDINTLSSFFDLNNISSTSSRTSNFMTGSAKTSKGIAEAFQWVVTTIKSVKESKTL